MLTFQHIQVIQDSQTQSIAQKSLVEAQLQMIYENNWFNIWVPKAYGGKEMDLMDGISLLEELAYWDGGLGWTVTLCAGANMFAGYIDPQLAGKVFSDPEVCFGGSGRVGGKAVWDGQKYILSGVWQFATGAPHLSHFTLNCHVYDGDIRRLGENGEPLVLSFFVPREYVLIHYDWDTFGLECTASHSFSVDEVPVDPRYGFQILPEKRQSNSPLYRLPFMPFAEVTLLANYVGMYRRFLDLVEKHFIGKSKDAQWNARFGRERFTLLDSLRVELAANWDNTQVLVADLWDKCVAGTLLAEDTVIQEIAALSRSMVKAIREQTVALYPWVGIAGAQRDNALNIVFRNIFTATQHSLLNA
ncbi:acyl-CoA dehydrogenase [Sphingobacterium sp. SGG-5]|uniref:acyl-CoA dehydrogenase family protein n=1 Tax=Sphingobacterium sp. SGG-5 TaxID=2710881 RepID=UPI0013E99F88|nr:acyl-CoA dehydrogenase family protein [Sphingobacterium sp. SGG-5]NGM62118.1 acyl-CoA dehydrogenase [Sphingobacterium sp. SGG-5]